MLNGTTMTLSLITSFLCSMPTSPFFSMIMPPHTARDTVNFLRTNNIDFIDDWPANSPDLNPIEHVWDSLDRRLRCHPNPPANVNNLRQVLIQEWNNIPQAEINTLVNSMQRQCTAVANSRGGHTHYIVNTTKTYKWYNLFSLRTKAMKNVNQN